MKKQREEEKELKKDQEKMENEALRKHVSVTSRNVTMLTKSLMGLLRKSAMKKGIVKKR